MSMEPFRTIHLIRVVAGDFHYHHHTCIAEGHMVYQVEEDREGWMTSRVVVEELHSLAGLHSSGELVVAKSPNP